jgi:hypothetical protein
MMLTQQPSDDGDLIAAFATLRTASVPLRSGFVAELRACLLAEIAEIHKGRLETTPHAATYDDGTVRKGRRLCGVRASGADLRRVRGPARAAHQSTRAGCDTGC